MQKSKLKSGKRKISVKRFALDPHAHANEVNTIAPPPKIPKLLVNDKNDLNEIES